MPTQTSSLANATAFSLTLRGRGRRILHDVDIQLDSGGVWRVSRLTDRLHRVDWFPELREHALRADLLSDREKEIWDFTLAKSRTFQLPSQYIGTIYNRLLSENVRAIVTDRFGLRQPTPSVDNFLSLEFRPASRSGQAFTTKPLINRLAIDTLTVEGRR